jgi:hypothetical protein
MQRILVMLLIIAFGSAALEFAGDYDEVFENSPLMTLPAGHTPGDGHDPADHGISCDNCHFGGIHLTGLPLEAAVVPSVRHAAPLAGSPADLPSVWRIPPQRPPIA